MYRKIVFILAIIAAISAQPAWSSGPSASAETGVRDLGGLVLVTWADGRTPGLYSSEEFVEKYGLPADGSLPMSGDAAEGIIPTPGPPPPHSQWEPGDEVTYHREAEDEGVRYGRNTTYQRTNHDDWIRTKNDFFRMACSSSNPCPPQFVY